MVLVICLNPTLQKTLPFATLRQGQVNRTRVHYLDASGKGMNVARVLTQLGVPAVHLTHAGGYFRSLLLRLAEGDGVRVVAPDSGSAVRFCYTLLEAERGITTELVEEPEPVLPHTEGEVRKAFDALLKESRCVVISGTRAPGYSENLYADFVSASKGAGKKVLLDIRGKDLLLCLEHRPDVLKINLQEFTETFFEEKFPPGSFGGAPLFAQVESACKRLVEEYGVLPIITNGTGDTLYLRGGRLEGEPVEQVSKPINTTGCGDAFMAGFVAAWMKDGLPSQSPFQEKVKGYIREAHQVAALNAINPRPGRVLQDPR